VDVPRLRTERLELRGWREGDLDAYAAMYADPEVTRFIGGSVGRDQAWRGLALMVGHWSLRGHGQWAAERRADGCLLGRVGLWQPEGWPGLELGWALARHAWGAGYATEAARAAMTWAWAHLDAPALIAVIAPDNDPSVRVARRLGMRAREERELGGRPVVVFGIDRPREAPAPG
jgi:RimJ/RimL family protein N-acetyltransferase